MLDPRIRIHPLLNAHHSLLVTKTLVLSKTVITISTSIGTTATLLEISLIIATNNFASITGISISLS